MIYLTNLFYRYNKKELTNLDIQERIQQNRTGMIVNLNHYSITICHNMEANKFIFIETLLLTFFHVFEKTLHLNHTYISLIVTLNS